MKILSTTVLGLALLGAAGFAQAAGNCTVSLKGDDAMKFDLKEATVSASCPTITIELTHTGKMPAAAMGHNVVVSATKDMDAIARDGADLPPAQQTVGPAALTFAAGQIYDFDFTPAGAGDLALRFGDPAAQFPDSTTSTMVVRVR